MGFLQFIFSLMFVIPVGLIMLYLLKRLGSDMSDAVKREAKAEVKQSNKFGYEGRRYTPGYNKTYERPFSYKNSYMKEANTFGSSTAEIRRKELEKKQETKNNTARNIFDKRKKRKERKQRKNNR